MIMRNTVMMYNGYMYNGYNGVMMHNAVLMNDVVMMQKKCNNWRNSERRPKGKGELLGFNAQSTSYYR